MSAAFRYALSFVLQAEGEGTLVEDDAGKGPTRWGINSTANPGVDVRTMTEAQAAAIYKSSYWDALGLDALPLRIAIAVCDGAVNHGPQTSLKLLQTALGIPADGVMGPITAAAGKRPDALARYCSARIMRYAQHPQFQVFGPVWIRRVLDLHAYCQAIPE